MNIDWFNPYKDAPYSVGAVYLIILNLPREECFKLKNVILACMIPGPSKPKGNINTFLSPLVNDLKLLFHGVSVKSPMSYMSCTNFKAILTCITCDLPATRKVCGYTNFNGRRGCSKCLKEFNLQSDSDKPDYSGFECHLWKKRDSDKQRTISMKFKNSNTLAACNKIQKETGVNYSVLLELPAYFDMVRYHVVDPMHNIFLGIAKHTIRIEESLA